MRTPSSGSAATRTLKHRVLGDQQLRGAHGLRAPQVPAGTVLVSAPGGGGRLCDRATPRPATPAVSSRLLGPSRAFAASSGMEPLTASGSARGTSRGKARGWQAERRVPTLSQRDPLVPPRGRVSLKMGSRSGSLPLPMGGHRILWLRPATGYLHSRAPLGSRVVPTCPGSPGCWRPVPGVGWSGDHHSGLSLQPGILTGSREWPLAEQLTPTGSSARRLGGHDPTPDPVTSPAPP